MEIRQALKTYLLAQSGLKALIGQRLYYSGETPQTVQTPYVVMEKVSSLPTHSHDGNSHLDNTRIQFSIFADTIYETVLIAAQIKVIDGFKGTMGTAPGVNVGSCFYDNEIDLFDNGLHHLAVDYIIRHDS